MCFLKKVLQPICPPLEYYSCRSLVKLQQYNWRDTSVLLWLGCGTLGNPLNRLTFTVRIQGLFNAVLLVVCIWTRLTENLSQLQGSHKRRQSVQGRDTSFQQTRFQIQETNKQREMESRLIRFEGKSNVILNIVFLIMESHAQNQKS